MAVLVSDSFNRADNATTLGTTDSFNGGTAKTWVAVRSTWGIIGNQAYQATNAAIDNSAVYVDAGASDGTVTVTMSTIVIAGPPILALRIAGTTTLSYLSLQADGPGYHLYDFSGSSWSTLATFGTRTSGDVIKAELQGSTIKLYLNGTLMATVTSARNQTSTWFGLNSQNQSTNRFDNFQIDSLATGGTGTPGSISYATKQSIYQTSSAALATKQVINSLGATAYATKQTIYQVGSISYATQQTITNNGIPGAIDYRTKQTIYQVSSAQMATKQAIYRIGSSQWATQQSIMDFVQILRKIRLKGERKMKIKLLGSRQLVVRLKGELPLAKKNQNFEIDVGDSANIEITATDSGTPINLSGATIQWEMRNGPGGPLVLSKSTTSGVTITNSSGGVFEIRLNSADTAPIRAGRYYHEARIIDATGFVSTVTKGDATFVN